jgi:hypothetical protein
MFFFNCRISASSFRDLFRGFFRPLRRVDSGQLFQLSQPFLGAFGFELDSDLSELGAQAINFYAQPLPCALLIRGRQ